MTVERRSSPRVHDENVSLRLKIDESDAITHTLNISASGVYCKVSKEIPLMSRVRLVLMLPGHTTTHESSKVVEVTGVVVREHPVIINGEIKHYDVAIFFDDLSAKDKETISRYVTHHLT